MGSLNERVIIVVIMLQIANIARSCEARSKNNAQAVNKSPERFTHFMVSKT